MDREETEEFIPNLLSEHKDKYIFRVVDDEDVNPSFLADSHIRENRTEIVCNYFGWSLVSEIVLIPFLAEGESADYVDTDAEPPIKYPEDVSEDSEAEDIENNIRE